MPGFDVFRFVNLNQSKAQHLKYRIFDKIFQNPVITRCGHTFCKERIKNDIKENNGNVVNGQQLVHKRGRERGKSINIEIYDFCAHNKSLFNIINE
jgi:hypothetical protein